jgi:putative endonuclease
VLPRGASHALRAFVYIISNKSHTLYVGITTDLANRFREHINRTYENGFTARYHFDRLVYFEAADSLADAAKRERQIKGWSRAKKVALIQEKNPDWMDLSWRLNGLELLQF